MIENMSKYQIACKPGHRVTEHIFVIMSALAVLEKKKKAAIFSAWDIKKFFDSEVIEDVMAELYRSQVRGKAYRLLFRLNENTNICIKTPVGITNYDNIGSGVTQGGVDAAIISSVSVDNSVVNEFSDSTIDSHSNHILLDCIDPKEIFQLAIYYTYQTCCQSVSKFSN